MVPLGLGRSGGKWQNREWYGSTGKMEEKERGKWWVEMSPIPRQRGSGGNKGGGPAGVRRKGWI